MILLILLLPLAACTSKLFRSSPAENAADNPSAAGRTLCYLLFSGKEMDDSTAIRLHLLPERKVSGEYIWYPEGKDPRMGIL